MRITKQQLQQIIKEEMEAELSEDKYATEDDRPLGTGRSLMSAKDAREALKTAELLYKEIGTTKIGAKISAAARAYASDLYAMLQKGVPGQQPEPEGLGGPSSAEEMESWESDYRDPPREPLKMGKGRRAPTKAELDMMKDYDI